MLLSLFKIECGTIAHNQLPEHTTTPYPEQTLA
jgi:hypothetical protein